METAHKDRLPADNCLAEEIVAGSDMASDRELGGSSPEGIGAAASVAAVEIGFGKRDHRRHKKSHQSGKAVCIGGRPYWPPAAPSFPSIASMV